MADMTSQQAQKVDSSDIEIIDGQSSIHLGEPEILGHPDRRSRWAATALATVAAMAAVATAIVLAVSAVVLGAIFFTAGLLIRLAMAIAGANHRIDRSR